MVSVTVTYERTGETEVVALEDTLTRTKADTLKTAEGVLRREQRLFGFPTDPKEYLLLLTNRGRTNRRQFESINPFFLRIPYRLRWVSEVGQNTEAVKQATVMAIQTLRRRAPVRSGRYLASTSIWLNYTPISLVSFLGVELKVTDVVFVAPDVPYGAVIELGFYKNRYLTQTIRGGIVRPIARMVRDRFGEEVSARFVYINPGRGTQKYGTLPAIQIGSKDSILENDSRPGRRARKRYSRNAETLARTRGLN